MYNTLVQLSQVAPVAVALFMTGAFLLFLLGMATPDEESPEPRKTIVLIDDDGDVRRGLRALIQVHTDLRIVGEAPDGRSGVQVVEAHHPDLVVVDVRMPVMDGIEAARRIHELDPNVCIVGFSSTDDDPTGAIMRRAGASDCLVKGDTPERIIEVLSDFS